MTLIRMTLIGSGLTLALSLLSGCATTPSLSPEQCQAGNWQQIGYADGMVGRSGAYFAKHLENCTPIPGSAPNRMLWEQGRQEGLKEFCTELNAYKLGREGYSWQPVCPLDGIEKLEDAYNQGRYYYLRQRDMEYLSTPYPWGCGPSVYGPYSYGRQDPFWRPRVW